MEFHPNGQIALFAGLDKSLRLFEIDGRQNPHLQTIFFEDMPIFSAHFTPDGKEIILSGNKPYFYVYDVMANRVDKVSHITGAGTQRQLKRMLVSPDNKYIVFIGDNGEIILVSNKTKQWVSNLKMSTKIIHCACFTADGKHLYVAGSASFVFILPNLFFFFFFFFFWVPRFLLLLRRPLQGFMERPNEGTVKPYAVFFLFLYAAFILCGTASNPPAINLPFWQPVSLSNFFAYLAAEAGEIFVWDMETLSCVRRYKDEGALKVTCMAISQDGQYQAIGQDSGVVNIYKMSDPSFQTYVTRRNSLSPSIDRSFADCPPSLVLSTYIVKHLSP
jgi:WD40 repeat protein